MSNNEIVSIAMDESLAKKLTNHVAGLGMTKNQYLRNLIMQDLMPRPGERAISLEEALLKENAGLRLNLYKYKRKYKTLNRILRGGLHDKIQWCDTLRMSYAKRLNRADTDEEKKALRALIELLRSEKAELETIYEMCIEATKD
jgi:hypothetical protein